jgi:hypothetical protein
MSSGEITVGHNTAESGLPGARWLFEKWKEMRRLHVRPRWHTCFFSVCASIGALLLGYLMLSASAIVAANLPWSKADPALKNAALTKANVIDQLFNERIEHRLWLIAGLAIGTAIVAYLCYVFLRRPLLENRRLRFMAGFSPYGGGFRAYGVCSIFVIGFGIWLYLSSDVLDDRG